MNRINPDLQEFRKLLDRPSNIAILSHRNPDGDAIGSSIALGLYLMQYAQQPTIIYPSEYPVVFDWMPGINNTLIFDNESELVEQKIKSVDVIYCVDFNGLDRIDKLGELVATLDVPKVMIDHHIDPEPFSDITFSDPTASSTCELIYRLIEMLGDKDKITADIAASIYTGILTDTGQFHHLLSPELFEICAELITYKFDYQFITEKVAYTYSEKQLRILGDVLVNKMEVIPSLKAAIIHLTKDDYKNYNIQRGDTEGIVNYPMMIPGIEVSAFIHEQPAIIKLSLRSRGDISVQELARDHFNGGGHKNAAGGAIYGSLDKTIDKFKKVLPFYLK